MTTNLLPLNHYSANMENQTFNFNGQSLSVLIDSNKSPLFIAKEICEVLEVGNPSQALSRLDEDEKNTIILNDGNKGNPLTLVINESGLYSLVLSSRKPEAKKFKKWVTSEVLPEIRKHGAYLTDTKIDEVLSDPDTLIKLATQLKSEREEKQRLIEEKERKEFELQKANETIKQQEPSVAYVKQVLSAPELTEITIIAKDLGMSAIKLNRILHEKGVQFKQGGTWVLYAKYQNKGYTKTKTFTYEDPKTGETHVSIKTYWTQRGRAFIHNLINPLSNFKKNDEKERI